MATITKSIYIDLPIETVFDFTGDGRNTPKYYDILSGWKPLSDQYKGGGAKFSYYIISLGINFEIVTEIIEEIENNKRTIKTVKGPKIKAQWIFNPVTIEGTEVTYRLEYELPFPIIGNFLDSWLVKPKRESEIERMLGNLKNLLETTVK